MLVRLELMRRELTKIKEIISKCFFFNLKREIQLLFYVYFNKKARIAVWLEEWR